ncbi:MAG: tryptophan synthase [Bacteroidota bacterium]|jgi:tryptophan synthase alpha chain
MNKIYSKILEKGNRVLNIYVTAGFPKLDSLPKLLGILNTLEVDLVEIGIPYSDPLADGPTIQNSSEKALKNGMTLHLLFNQLNSIKNTNKIPLILMGYYNQLLQFGVESFLQNAAESGISGLIIPDLPMEIYENKYKRIFEKYNMGISFLITPNTSEERIIKADELSNTFVYAVSQTSITGKTSQINKNQYEYFEKLKNFKFKNPYLIGFGIHDKYTFDEACNYSQGAIIGSAFIRVLESDESEKNITHFINGIK